MTRVVLVTGASSGIGRAVCLALADRGDILVLVARRQRELEDVAEVCADRGAGRVLVKPADVADLDAWEAVFAEAVEELGCVDVVVHAAAVAAYGRFADVPPEVFDRVQEINVRGTANVARSSVRLFGTQGRGHLVVIGSLVGTISTPNLSPYVTSKWAVHGLTRTLQAEYQRGPVSVSLVEPGGVSTTIYDKAASYLGVQGKPPPPVYGVQRVARAVVGVIDRPRRERPVGLLNPLVTTGFRLLPSVFDRVVGPLMRRVALADEPVAGHTGNLFDPTAEPEPALR